MQLSCYYFVLWDSKEIKLVFFRRLFRVLKFKVTYKPILERHINNFLTNDIINNLDLLTENQNVLSSMCYWSQNPNPCLFLFFQGLCSFQGAQIWTCPWAQKEPWLQSIDTSLSTTIKLLLKSLQKNCSSAHWPNQGVKVCEKPKMETWLL